MRHCTKRRAAAKVVPPTDRPPKKSPPLASPLQHALKELRFPSPLSSPYFQQMAAGGANKTGRRGKSNQPGWEKRHPLPPFSFLFVPDYLPHKRAQRPELNLSRLRKETWATEGRVRGWTSTHAQDARRGDGGGQVTNKCLVVNKEPAGYSWCMGSLPPTSSPSASPLPHPPLHPTFQDHLSSRRPPASLDPP